MSDLPENEEQPEHEERRRLSQRIVVVKGRFSIVYKHILKGVKTETRETKQATKIVIKYVAKGSITKEEETELRKQVYDILKAVGVGIPFALIPGASILIPILIKVAQKKGINLLPSAFSDDEDLDEN